MKKKLVADASLLSVKVLAMDGEVVVRVMKAHVEMMVRSSLDSFVAIGLTRMQAHAVSDALLTEPPEEDSDD